MQFFAIAKQNLYWFVSRTMKGKRIFSVGRWTWTWTCTMIQQHQHCAIFLHIISILLLVDLLFITDRVEVEVEWKLPELYNHLIWSHLILRFGFPHSNKVSTEMIRSMSSRSRSGSKVKVKSLNKTLWAIFFVVGNNLVLWFPTEINELGCEIGLA